MILKIFVGVLIFMAIVSLIITELPSDGRKHTERFEDGGHWYLRERGFSEYPKPFMHDPDCPCGWTPQPLPPVE